MDDFGENIWNISSWTTDIQWKDSHLHRYFDSLTFTECIKEILDLAETYFQSVYDACDDDEGAELDFPYLDIVVLLTEEYLYGHYFTVVTPLQELQLLETLCCYFQENKLDPVRYFVFDCLFGLPCENLELQKGLVDHKMNIMCKLSSMAIGTGCGHILNCVAVWFHTYGSHYGRASRLAHSIVNDYCFICPKAIGAVKDLIDVSPVFSHQWLIALSDYHKEHISENKDEIPPALLVNVIATWIIEQPNFCAVKIPRVFLELPSVHKYVVSMQNNLFKFSPLFTFLEWCLVEPLARHQIEEDTAPAYAMLHYGFLNYISMQRKVQPILLDEDDEDDLEPGELLEENDSVELITHSDMFYLIGRLNQFLDNYQDASLLAREESINRLVQIVQISTWAGCISLPSKNLLPTSKLPKTRLLDQVLAAAS